MTIDKRRDPNQSDGFISALAPPNFHLPANNVGNETFEQNTIAGASVKVQYNGAVSYR